jgi:hypothetical protein
MRIQRLLVLALLLIYPMKQGVAMSVLDIGKVCAASEIDAVITIDGKPVSGVEFLRTVKWHDVGEKTDRATTDNDGRLHFPALYMRSVSRQVMLMEFISEVTVNAVIENKDYELLYAIKRLPEENKEYGGEARVFRCELKEEQTLTEFGANTLETVCIWE